MKIPLFKIYSDKKDIEAVTKVIRAKEDWAIGQNIKRLEELLAEYVGTKHAVLFNSGTSALHALMIASGIGLNNEVILPSFTFIATANAPLFVGAKPVFAEIESETYGLDPGDVERKITKNTRAIMPVHYGGGPCKIRELAHIAKKHNVLLIEDAAESLGAKIGGKRVGTFGDAAMFSFCAPKVITTGEGGAIVTNSTRLYEKLMLVRSHGRQESENYFATSSYMDYVELGYNFRMSNITAALGISQLKKIDKIIRMRQGNAKYLTEKLSSLKEISLPLPPKGYTHIFQMYTVRVGGGELTRNRLKKYLNQRGVMAKVYFPPIHLTSFYRKRFGYKENDLATTERLSGEVLTLPMYPTITRHEMDYTASQIERFFREKKRKKLSNKSFS